MADSRRRTIYERSCRGRRAFSLPDLDVPEIPLGELLPAGLRRAAPARLPEVSEVDLLRHFTELSTLNFGVETGSYPLGSCTMKYNPKVNEVACRLEGFAGLHPFADLGHSPGRHEELTGGEQHHFVNWAQAALIRRVEDAHRVDLVTK